MNRFTRCCVFCFLGLGFASSVSAQDILEQYYGRGVHAYFAGNVQLAEEHFNDVVNAGSQDPRVYYFRGLSQIQSQGGMIDAGMADFEQAAQREVAGKRSGDVAKALSRIQGPTRLAIENARAKARLAAKSQQFETIKNKFEQPGAAGAAVMPRTPDAAVPAIPNNASNANDPFASGAGMTGGEATPMPAAGEAPPANSLSPFENPAGEPAMPAPANANPFGDDPTPAPGAPPAVDPNNPFGN